MLKKKHNLVASNYILVMYSEVLTGVVPYTDLRAEAQVQYTPG